MAETDAVNGPFENLAMQAAEELQQLCISTKGSKSSSTTARPEAGPDDLTCAICLEQVSPVDMATIKGCEHLYCVHCILQWALCTETARCPQCKAPFTYIFCHRLLDGTVVDFPIEETITLLKRAKWFEEHLKLSEKGQAALQEAERRGLILSSVATGGAPDWQSEFYEDFEDAEQDEDEEIEQFYFSAAAGRARVFGNRRLGENGYLRSGRQYARPLPRAAPTSLPPAHSKGKGKASSSRAAAAAGPASRKTPECGAAADDARPACASSSSSGAVSSSSNAVRSSHSKGKNGGSSPLAVQPGAAVPVDELPQGSGGKGVGRRAQRKARRNFADEGEHYDDG